MPKSPKLDKIKSSTFSRGLALARMSLSAGTRVAGHAVGTLFSTEEEKAAKLKELLTTQMASLSQELGKLKGSLMKVGQMLSMYGEHFLPPEANTLLKSLQSQSPPLNWNEIEKVIRKNLSAERLAELEIDQEPLASASLGQVHRARRKSDGILLAMKIQYPGVDRAIEGDLKALKSILSVANLLPKGPRYDAIFDEVKEMLHQEVDYLQEMRTTQEFKHFLSKDSRYIVPTVFPEYSSSKILTTSLEEGIPVDSSEVLSLSQERRNAIGILALELYFKELFEFAAVQTDPHFGNYRVRLGKEGEPDKLVLLDFGAVRKLSQPFLKAYLEMVKGAFERDTGRIVEAGTQLGFLHPEDTQEQKKVFTRLCMLVTEPFYTPITPGVPAHLYDVQGAYDWGKSDLPKRVTALGKDFILAFKLRTPPREVVFLDRKLGGIFIFLSVLKIRIRGRDSVSQFIK